MELTVEEQRALGSRRIRGLAGAFSALGVEIAVQKIAVPSGEPACHWYFVMPAGIDPDHSDPEAPFGHGTSFVSFEEAISRAFGEFAERYVLSRDDLPAFVRASWRDLVSRGERALDPRAVAGLSDEFRLAHPKHLISDETVFAWVEGRTVPFWQKILVPAQLVYVPYASGRGEPKIRQPLTTGAAFGWSFAEAFWRGLAEVIERDAFMITWLARRAPARIDLSGARDPALRALIAGYESIGVEAHAFDVTTDAGAPTALALLLDRTGAGPAVIVGCRTSFDAALAIRDAFRQAHNVRAGMTARFREWKAAASPPIEIGDSIPNRVLFWSPTERINDIKFLFADPDHLERASSFQRHPESSTFVPFSVNSASPEPLGCHSERSEESRGKLCEGARRILGAGSIRSIFRAWRGLPASFGELIVVDVTPAALKPFGRVVKAILPGAQPLHLSETFPNFGGKRWRIQSGDEGSNPLPHPFI